MKAKKKILVYLGVLILGSVIAAVIDHLIGVSFTDVSMAVQVTHKATYMVWGGALLVMGEWLIGG